MRTENRFGALTVALLVAASAGPHAQGRGGGAWSTVGGDPQRTGWARTDPRISKESVAKPGLQLLWKRQLQKGAAALTQPVLLPNIISYKGFKALAYLGGPGDAVYSIDYDLNRMFWETRLSSAAKGTLPACAGGTIAVTRSATLGAPAGGRGGRGQGGPPPPAAAAPPTPGAPGTPPPAGGAPAGIPPGAGSPAPAAAQGEGGRGRGAGGGGGLGGGRGAGNNVYAVSTTGMVHALNPQTGEDLNPPAKFTGGSARLSGAVFIDNVVYAAVVEPCGGVASGVYAIDLTENANTVSSFDAKGARVAGALGPAFATDGTLFVATGGSTGDATYANAIVALDARTLKPKDWFTAPAPFTSSPVVFTQGTRTLVAASNADGSVYLLDAASLGGADHKAPLAKSGQFSQAKDFAAGAITTWEDGGIRWIAAATAGPLPGDAKFGQANGAVKSGGIVAFRLTGEGSVTTLEPAWTSRDVERPGAPIVLNGVVFAVSAGAMGPGKGRSVLYAFDSATGKELWNSGNAISSYVPGVPPSAGDGQIYVVTADGTLYAFGIPLEH
ncbi:MAG TPA: PQQ-binding-like beta-propeller repeat protein [Vicinamibacterales bacterium]|nr:PQQ-binding-like beta-propeller repeat protein [Vicinamibacterales bacterium]